MKPLIFFKKTRLLTLVSLLFMGGCGNGNTASTSGEGNKNNNITDTAHTVEDRVLGLKLLVSDVVSPVAMAAPKDGSGRVFICHQNGKVSIFRSDSFSLSPFLDIEERVDRGGSSYSEKGLLGMAFHPDFKNNGQFYIYYSSKKESGSMDHIAVLSGFKTMENNPDKADPDSEKIIMEIGQPKSNHNGGQLAFGPDGYLYLGLGDGGGAGDEFGETGNGQNLSTLLGSIIRIDVDNGSPYAIPPDNPFVNKEGRDEIFAYGLRNPWRFSFAPDGRLFCGDVGQNKWEEVDIIKKGGNYGWRFMEGNHCYNPEDNCQKPGMIMPIDEYSHDVGISITGGYVYRGEDIPWLKGKYIFGDWRGPVFYLEESNGKWKRHNAVFNSELSYGTINSFGEDEYGELYLLAQKNTGPEKSSGKLYKFIAP